ncbi:MAG: CRTAC1 family protein [Gemmatimonadales bacterium]
MSPSALRRTIVAAVFFGVMGLAVWLDRRVGRDGADLEHPGFSLEDVTAASGITFIHRQATLDPKLANVEPHIAGVGAAVSVTDVDGDGAPDLFFPNSRFGSASALYRNRGDGTFEDIADAAGLAHLSREGEGATMGAVWGDVDNDGREDVLVYRYGYLSLFRNVDGHRFEDITEAAGLRRWFNSNGAIWFDYDRDGRLDLYVTAYFRSDIDLWHVGTTRIMHDSFEFATNGGANALFHNLGGGRFEDVTAAMGVGSTRWTLAASAADFDNDGWPDLYLANDYGPEELFHNDGGRGFSPMAVGLEKNSKSGMSVAVGDIYNRGRHDVYITNISEKGFLFQNNNLRLNLLGEVGRLENVAAGAVADGGWSWGSQFGDLNNDGAVDLYVANGFISADRDKDYWYSMSKIAGGNGRLFEDAANWPPFGTASLSGYERSRVYLNRGKDPWVDVAERVGVGDVYDGRAVAFADLRSDGALDVIVADQNQPAVVYRNRPDPANHWIGLQLVGTTSNRSAIGAEVEVTFGSAKQLKTVSGGSGFASQNDRRLHFGLGELDRVDRVEIRWPSGVVQDLRFPAVDRIHRIEEPAKDER